LLITRLQATGYDGGFSGGKPFLEFIVLTTRPKVTELVFHLYGRSLHPELLTVENARTFERGPYTAKVEITRCGHVVTWRRNDLAGGDLVLTEVATSSTSPLPRQRRILARPLRGRRTEKVTYRDHIQYQVDFQLEPVDPEVFWTFQQELTHDGIRKGLFHKFDSSGRMSLGAVSYINVESRNKTFFVQAFHTFPDDCAIVKSQSLFQLG